MDSSNIAVTSTVRFPAVGRTGTSDVSLRLQIPASALPPSGRPYVAPLAGHTDPAHYHAAGPLSPRPPRPCRPGAGPIPMLHVSLARTLRALQAGMRTVAQPIINRLSPHVTFLSHAGRSDSRSDVFSVAADAPLIPTVLRVPGITAGGTHDRSMDAPLDFNAFVCSSHGETREDARFAPAVQVLITSSVTALHMLPMSTMATTLAPHTAVGAPASYAPPPPALAQTHNRLALTLLGARAPPLLVCAASSAQPRPPFVPAPPLSVTVLPSFAPCGKWNASFAEYAMPASCQMESGPGPP